MAVRSPKSLATVIDAESGLSMVEAEMLAESASSLGHHGKKLEKALAELRQATPEADAELKHKAAYAAWQYFIQRELCGMRDHRMIIKEMGIPQDILNMMGAVGTR